MRLDLPFSYPLILRRSRRHKPFVETARDRASFEIDDIDDHRLPVREIYDARGVDHRIAVRGIPYRELPDKHLAPARYEALLNIGEKPIDVILGKPARRWWWMDAYGDLPVQYPLKHPTAKAVLARYGMSAWQSDDGQKNVAWIDASAAIRDCMVVFEGRILIASAEPVWKVLRGPAGISVGLALDAGGPAHNSFAFGRRDEAVAYAASFPSFDGIVPTPHDGIELTSRDDSIAIARELLPLLPSLWQASAVLGDAEFDGGSCYAAIARLILEKPPLDIPWANAAIDAASALHARWRGLLARHLTAEQLTLLRGTYRRRQFELGGEAFLDDIDREALRL